MTAAFPRPDHETARDPAADDAGPLGILHIFRTPVGGLFRHVLDLARGQADRGHRVGLVCDSTTGGARAEAALAELAPHLALGLSRLPMHRLPHPADIAATVAIGRIAARLRPDVLHGHGSKGGLYARLAPAPRGLRPIRVYTPHGGSFHYRPGSLQHLLYANTERLLARRTDLFLFESAYVAERFRETVGASRGLVRIVHNGLHPHEFEPVTPNADAADILYIGEMRMLKGVDVLIDALALLRTRDGRRLTAVFVGAGPNEAAFRERARAAGLADGITFLPPEPIRTALARARLMVVPSRAESLPYVVLEAAAAGMPLVATNVGGIPEIFGEEAHRLVPPGDVEALAGALDSLNPATDHSGAEIRSYVESRFSVKLMTDRIIECYITKFNNDVI